VIFSLRQIQGLQFSKGVERWDLSEREPDRSSACLYQQFLELVGTGGQRFLGRGIVICERPKFTASR
jgi:hypothetical protein